MSGPKLRVNRIQRFSLHDGPGIRTTVFVQGCPVHCWWCHNPETWAENSASMRAVIRKELVAELERDALYWRESGGGVTISGGEPLAQAEAVGALLEVLKENGHQTAVDTSGMGEAENVRLLDKYTDLWLWDVKTVNPQRLVPAEGGSYEVALDSLSWLLAEADTAVVVRVPLIAGFNASAGEMEALAEWLSSRKRRVDVEVLPGHSHGVAKRDGVEPDSVVPTAKQIESARRILGKAGLNVKCPAPGKQH
jgi:pyruvate formate lyase activating enzyme